MRRKREKVHKEDDETEIENSKKSESKKRNDNA
jgi:hypothetical protein